MASRSSSAISCSIGEQPPKVGDAPQVWVEVDTTKPIVQLKGVEVGRGQDTGNLTINWSASDKNFSRQPISLSYDHRVIDGALAARFTRHLCTTLEDVRRLIL